MDKIKETRRIAINDMETVFLISEKGAVSFSLIPKEKNGIQSGRELFFEKAGPDPLVQISVTGDASCPGFAAGETRHNSAFTGSLKFLSQDVRESAEEKRIETTVISPEGIKAVHTVAAKGTDRSIRVFTRVINDSEEAVTIEALSSANLSALTPYTADEGRDRLKLHRFRSRWSAEGRHEERTIEELLLEPSWAEFAVRCEKFGTKGSMPVRGYFPFAAVEDREEGVFWAMSLACPSSWQFEAVRIDRGLSLSCGLADYEYGHWRKTLERGESFTTPEAYVTVARCDLNEVCDRLLDVQRSRLFPLQKKTVLPAVFNEYCTTWGEPSEENIEKILKVVRGRDFEYFVIDAGWYADSMKGWQDNMGDWRVAPDLFPKGIKSAVEKIKSAGMKAGVWFELEVVGRDSNVAYDRAHLLKRDGKVVISGTRRFWDMRLDWVNEYLGKKVISFLRENGFEYVKIDYNETIGIGCDGAESPGEGLRQCLYATEEFYKRIREEVPGIAIEVCSSGGHRLEPSFMELADYLSFSDAHEEKEIPVIALDLQSLILPEKSQIWAVLRKSDGSKRIAYSICAGMYGVLCVSGDVSDLSKEQWELALRGVHLYKKASPVIIKGKNERFGPFQNSNRALKGYQAAVRYGENGRALVIVHSFEHGGIQEISIPLKGKYKISDSFEAMDHKVKIGGSTLNMEFTESFDALSLLLELDG